MNSAKDSAVVLAPGLIKPVSFSLSRLDKLIFSAHAIFEGVGIAGLISAAFWYTTAPIAPDGFKGPISTYTIATTTIISLLLAIPIASLALKKLIKDMVKLYAQLNAEMMACIHSYELLVYELFKFRSLCDDDEAFYTLLAPLKDKALLQLITQQFMRLSQLKYRVQWGNPCLLIPAESPDVAALGDLISNHHISAHQGFSKGVITLIKDECPEVQPNDVIKKIQYQALGKSRSHVYYGTASGVACAEVLLSIGWTVISVLIGVGAIVPISNNTWLAFALFSITAGVLFGLGMGLSRWKEQKIQAIYFAYEELNQSLQLQIDTVRTLLAEFCFARIGRSGDNRVRLKASKKPARGALDPLHCPGVEV